MIARPLLLALALFTPSIGGAETTLARVFTDHMVLQRELPVVIFGKDEPGQQIDLQFGSQTISTKADAKGNWRLNLEPMPAQSVGRDLQVKGSSSLTLIDVMVGEVWLAAGQSNMDWQVRQCSSPPHPENFPLIRMANWSSSVGVSAGQVYDEADFAKLTPDKFYRGEWQKMDPQSIKPQSGVAYFFANALARELKAKGPDNSDIPIGIVDISRGGTTSEAFIDPEVLRQNPYLSASHADPRQARTLGQWATSRIRKNLGSYEHSDASKPHPHPFAPGFLNWTAMPHLLPFTFRGVIWYQGESNAEFTTNGFMWNGQRLSDYQHMVMTTLIESWREAFDRPKLPFYMVELPRISASNRTQWPWYRNAQQRTAHSIEGAELAVVTEFGVDGSNVHPHNKEPVGERLALIARAKIYGEALETSGPIYAEHKIVDDEIYIRFAHAEGGLIDRDGGTLRHFEIADRNRRFVPATATISGSNVKVSAPSVREPIAVRYAWDMNIDVDLSNTAKLTAASFRTDSWVTSPGRVIRVACIGDSITFGAGIEDRVNKSYPAQLATLLGEGFEVRGFGKSGYGIHRPAKKYDRTEEFQAALAYEPDIVICNLGINDITQWGSYSRQDMLNEYRKLIDPFASLKTRPYIIQWQPLAPLFAGQKFHGDPNVDTLNQWIADAVASTGVAHLDMLAPLKGHPEWFPDHIHPNELGSEVIAQEIHRYIASIDQTTAPGTTADQTNTPSGGN